MIKQTLSAAAILAALRTPVGQALAECVDINSALRGDLMRIVHIHKVRSSDNRLPAHDVAPRSDIVLPLMLMELALLRCGKQARSRAAGRRRT